MWNTLRASASCIGTCRNHFRKLWTVSRSHWCTVLINTFHSDWIWFTYKLLVWGEGHYAIWSNGVSSLTWNGLLLASIFEAWLNCLIDWNQWIATLESWSACLRNTLRTGAGRCGAGRSYLSILWTVCRYHWCTVLIHSLHSDWIWFTHKLLVWRESHCTIWSNRVGSLTWNGLLLASIFKGRLNGFINWN
ncbi:hypothetical protein D8889_10960 [Streptococcus sanguinis]|nr:hypothetical protein D8889_10960 [Streptococcus sanguinis]